MTFHVELGPQQEQALEELSAFLGDPSREMFILEGYAGTGKSTLCSALLASEPRLNVAFCATTNKATKVLAAMADNTGASPHICTIHKLLKLVPEEVNGVFRCRQMAEPHLDNFDLIVVDECSMINADLWNHIQDIPCISKAKVLLMGDPAQLPPVGEVSSPSFEVPYKSRLTQIFRQGAGHPLLAYSMKLRLAMEDETLPIPMPEPSEQVQCFQELQDWLAAWKTSCESEASKWDVDRVRLLTWTNARVQRWNAWLTEQCFPDQPAPFDLSQPLVLTSPLLGGSWGQPRQVLMPTDEPLKLRRAEPFLWRELPLWHLDVEDSEGNVERITYVAPEQKHQVEQELKLWRQERSGGLPGASIQNWEQRCVAIQPAHAITVHRSQGSTFQDVFLDMPSLLANPRRNECLQLIYVAVTRARGRLWVLEP